MDNATASAGAAGQFTGLLAGLSSGKPPPICQYSRTFPGTAGRPGAVDAIDDSAWAAVPFEELRIRWRAMLKYTAASVQHDYATFLERADASV